MQNTNTFVIRPFTTCYRAAIRDICVATAWRGEPAPERIGDEWIWAEYWTRYFTDQEPRHAWVVEDTAGGRVVGYLTGTCDAARFERYLVRLLPGLIRRAWKTKLLRRTNSRRAVLGLLRSFVRSELALPPGVARAYPATFHVNLLPDARRYGLGSKLFGLYLEQMRHLGVRGIHVQTLSVNEEIARFNERAGFKLAATRPLRAFHHLDPRPLAVHTWVLEVAPS